MGLLKKAGGAAVLAGGAAALAKRLADRQQQKGRSQVADEPGGADGRAAPVPAPARFGLSVLPGVAPPTDDRTSVPGRVETFGPT